jgi:hypothetical protein
MAAHSHGDVSHDHGDAAPGHTHDAATAGVAPPTAAPGAALGTGMVVRALLTVLGAAGIIVGTLLDWLTIAGQSGGQGIDAPVRVFYTELTGVEPVGFLTSAGFVLIIIGALALVGLALPTGWLTRLMGALAIIAFVLFVISIYRVSVEDTGGLVDLGLGNVGIGMWLVLVGGVLAVAGGFFGARARPVATV